MSTPRKRVAPTRGPNRRSTDRRSDETSRKVEVWERHGQSIMLAVALASITFCGKFLWQTNTSITELKSESKHVSEKVNQVQGAISTLQNTYAQRSEMNALEVRVRTLETSPPKVIELPRR